MMRGGSGQGWRRRRLRGSGGQGGHLDGEVPGAIPEDGAGLGQQGRLVHPHAGGPGGAGRQQYNPSVADVAKPGLGGHRGGQQAAQPPVQRIEGARARDDFPDAEALHGGPWARRGGGGAAGSIHEFSGWIAMHIIILRKPGATPHRLNLGGRRPRFLLGLAVAGFALLFGALGATAALVAGAGRSHSLDEIAQLRGVLRAQRHALSEVEAEAHRNLDALALQLGQLQAQATRLNALGERLTAIGKLDDGEFDFASDVGLGGPDEPLAVVVARPLQSGVDALREEFVRQEAQLDVLENLLRDRHIDNALLPSGMPVQGFVSSGYGTRTDPLHGRAGIHRGVDFAAPHGADIHAAADGVVTMAGRRPGYGNVVEVDHGNGYMTRYAHNSRNLVEIGARVHAGQVIAKVGSSGRSTGAHLHFEVWLNGRTVNPMAYVRSARNARG